MKLCKDCKHYEADRHIDYDECRRPEFKLELSRGTNSLANHRKFCDIERDKPFPFDILFDNCGTRARYWEAK